MWLVGICPYCGTVVALQAPNMTVYAVFNREMYCPTCFDGRPTYWVPARADQIDIVYNRLRSKWLSHDCNPMTAKTALYTQIGGDHDEAAVAEIAEDVRQPEGEATAEQHGSPTDFADGKNHDE